MVKKMRAQSIGLLFFFMVLFAAYGLIGGAAQIGDQCARDFQKVTACLSYATGKAATPTRDCCSSVSDISQSDPACLCFIIQQIHNGSNPQLKSMGIQEARLLQLPSACNLVNASISDCPRLLNIPRSSPDYAIFTNSSSVTPPAATGTSSPAARDSANNGSKHIPKVAGPMAIAIAIFFVASPAGLLSTFCT